MYRLRTPPAEVARTLPIAMRRGSLSAAEEITSHKYETISRWLRAAAQQAKVITEVLVRDLHLTEVGVDAFWSFAKKVSNLRGLLRSPLFEQSYNHCNAVAGIVNRRHLWRAAA